MTSPQYPAIFQLNTRVRLAERSAALGRPATLDDLTAFYDALWACLRDPAFRDGDWRILDAEPAWPDNATNDAFVAFSWTGPGDLRRLVVVNDADGQSQCSLKLPWDDLQGRSWRLADRLGDAVYIRDGAELALRGLYLDLPAWGYHVFEVQPVLATLP